MCVLTRVYVHVYRVHMHACMRGGGDTPVLGHPTQANGRSPAVLCTFQIKSCVFFTQSQLCGQPSSTFGSDTQEGHLIVSLSVGQRMLPKTSLTAALAFVYCSTTKPFVSFSMNSSIDSLACLQSMLPISQATAAEFNVPFIAAHARCHC